MELGGALTAVFGLELSSARYVCNGMLICIDREAAVKTCRYVEGEMRLLDAYFHVVWPCFSKTVE